MYLRAARIVGESMRRLELAVLDLFDELGGPPPSQLRKGRSPEDAFRPSQLMNTNMEQLLVWLHRRHTVNLAARIAGHAAEGELLLLAEFAGAAADAGFACEEIGPVSLKGVAEPIPLARVLLGYG